MHSWFGRMRRFRPFFALAAALVLLTFFAGAALAAEGDQAAPHQGESYLMWVAKSSGAIGVVILILSVYFVATVVRMFMELREKVAAPPELIAQCEDLIQQRDFRQLYKVLRESDSFFGRTLSTGISELPNGLPKAHESMDRTSEAVTMEMERMISMLAVLGTLGPMIGLLGTLKGMIASFSVIAMSGTHLDASQVAGGISEALLLTSKGSACRCRPFTSTPCSAIAFRRSRRTRPCCATRCCGGCTTWRSGRRPRPRPARPPPPVRRFDRPF